MLPSCKGARPCAPTWKYTTAMAIQPKMWLQELKFLPAHSLDDEQVFQPTEGAMLDPKFNDALGKHGTDTG